MSMQNPILGEVVILADGIPAVLVQRGSTEGTVGVLRRPASGRGLGVQEVTLEGAVWGVAEVGGFSVGNTVQVNKEDHELHGKTGTLVSVPQRVFPYFLVLVTPDSPDGEHKAYLTTEHVSLRFVDDGTPLGDDFDPESIRKCVSPSMLAFLAGVPIQEHGVLTNEDVLPVEADEHHPVGSTVQIADPSVPAKDGMLGEVVATPAMREDRRYKVRLVDGQSYFTARHEELVTFSL